MTVRTRIAPSPTGFMHIGTLRTVMFDYFLARQNGGKFIVRIEDTDQERLVDGALESLLKTFAKLGIDYDEGPVLNDDGTLGEKGGLGPYIQSKRLDLYRPYAETLVEQGHAYICFCTKERLEEMRAEQIAAKQTPKYDRKCLKLTPDEVTARKAGGKPYVIRLKIPDGTSKFVDAIRGEISFQNTDVDDQVIVKSDGFASYHLAVVVDDHSMNITHVLRGEEWIPSTPKQIILHEMLGWQMPIYAHVPLILNPDKTKLSKRKGDVSVESFLAKGYLPEALINFISTLGFNPTADQEIYTREELIKLFNLSKVHSAGAVMNIEKLNWMNQYYIRTKSTAELVALCQPYLDKAGKSIEAELLQRIVEVEKQRLITLADIVDHMNPYLGLPEYDPAILVWKKADATDAKANLQATKTYLEGIEASLFTIADLEPLLKQFITDKGLSNGNVLWPLRVALSGAEKSPSPFEMAYVLQKDEVLRRIKVAVTKLN